MALGMYGVYDTSSQEQSFRLYLKSFLFQSFTKTDIIIVIYIIADRCKVLQNSECVTWDTLVVHSHDCGVSTKLHME